MKKRKASPYPEHEKLKALDNKNIVCGNFLEWLQDTKGYVLCEEHEHTSYCYDEEGNMNCEYGNGDMMPVRLNIESILADYFDINTKKLEEEKDKMLKDMRRVNAKQKQARNELV